MMKILNFYKFKQSYYLNKVQIGYQLFNYVENKTKKCFYRVFVKFPRRFFSAARILRASLSLGLRTISPDSNLPDIEQPLHLSPCSHREHFSPLSSTRTRSPSSPGTRSWTSFNRREYLTLLGIFRRRGCPKLLSLSSTPT